MVNIEETKKTLQTMLDIMIYIREAAPQYGIYFFNEYSEKDFFGWGGPNPFYDQIDNAEFIMKGFPGDFYTQLGSFQLFGSMSYTSGQEKLFYNHIKDKFGVIEIRSEYRSIESSSLFDKCALYAFSKDIEGDPLPTPNPANYQKHILKQTPYLSYEKSTNIWDNIKPKLIAEMFIRHPGILNPTGKPNFVLENEALSALWDNQSEKLKLKLMQIQTGLPDKSIEHLANKLRNGNNTLLKKAFQAYQSNSTPSENATKNGSVSNFFRPPSSPSRNVETIECDSNNPKATNN